MSVLGNVPGHPFTQRGYGLMELLRDGGDRYLVYKLRAADGRICYGKQLGLEVKPDRLPTLTQRIRIQAWYYDYVNCLSELQGQVVCPRVVELDPNGHFMISDWFQRPFYPEAGSVLTNLRHVGVNHFVKNASEFAKLLARLDRAAMLAPETGRQVRLLSHLLDGWAGIGIALETGLITAMELHDLKAAIKLYERYMVPCLQHTDLQPQHLYHVDGAIGLIDAENAGLDVARYYDVAEMYCRLSTICFAREAARRMLVAFLQETGADQVEFWKAFLAPFATRAAGMLADAAIHWRYEKIDYRPEARNLVDVAMKGNLAELL